MDINLDYSQTTFDYTRLIIKFSINHAMFGRIQYDTEIERVQDEYQGGRVDN